MTCPAQGRAQSGDDRYLRHHCHLSHTAGQEQAQIQVSFARHSLVTHPPADVSETAPLAGPSVGGRNWRATDRRSQGRSSWTPGHERPSLRGPCSENPSQDPCDQYQGSPKGKGQSRQRETTGQGSFLLRNNSAPLLQKAFLGYTTPDTFPSHQLTAIHSSELDSKPLAERALDRASQGQNRVVGAELSLGSWRPPHSLHFSAPFHTKHGGTTFFGSRSPSLNHPP